MGYVFGIQEGYIFENALHYVVEVLYARMHGVFQLPYEICHACVAAVAVTLLLYVVVKEKVTEH